LDIPGQPEHEPTIPDSEAEAEESEESEEPRLGEEAANSLSANNFSANNLESEDVEEHEEIEPSSTQNAEAEGLQGDYAAELAVDSDAGSEEDEIAQSGNSSTKELFSAFIKAFVITYQKVVERILRCENEDGSSFCVVLGSEPKVGADGNTAVSLQFHMPYAHAGLQIQTDIIRPNLITQLCLDNVQAKLPTGPLGGNWNEIIDKNIPCTNLPLYGSVRNKDEPVLKYWAIYQPSAHLDAPLPTVFEESFDISNHAIFKNKTVDDEFIDGWTSDEKLILYLSIDYFAKPMKLWKPQQAGLFSEDNHAPDGSVADIGEKLARANIFLKMMNPVKLLDNRTRQEEVAYALHTICKGSEEGLNVLANHIHTVYSDLLRQEMRKKGNSKNRCENVIHNETEAAGPGREALEVIDYKRMLKAHVPISRLDVRRDLIYAYNTPPEVMFTERTLAWYAKEDNPEDYNEWHEEVKKKALERAVSLTDYDIAQAFYEFNWLNMAYSPKDKGWYIYKLHRWRRCFDAETELIKIIDEYFIQDLIKFHASIAGEAAERRGQSQEANLKFSAGLLALVERLKKTTPLAAMLRRVKSRFEIENFSDMLDSRKDLLGMKNGVIEMGPKKAFFRAGKPEDYISKSTGIDYLVNFDTDRGHPLLVKYLDYLNKVHRNPNIRKFFRLVLASLLLGGNDEKIFDVWSGEFNNSKSVMVKILRKALGNYYVDFSTTLISGKKASAEAATPQLAQAKNARVGVLPEPDDDEEFKGGILKLLTGGGDSIFVRALYDQGGSSEFTVKLIVVCNKVPPVPRNGKAVEERVMVIPFLSTWSKDAPNSEEEQMAQARFKIDRGFERHIPDLARAMLWQMVQDFAEYRKEGLVIPKEVKDRTAAYWAETDIFKSFFAENVEKIPAQEEESAEQSYITLKELYTRYKEWFSEMCPFMKPVPNLAFKTKANEHLAPCNGQSRWYGYKIKTTYI